MGDALLSDADRQEALSRAYVQAIAAGAGYAVSQPDFDRDSVDVTISAGGAMRPRIDVQLKATINLSLSDTLFSFVLKLKNYNGLRVVTQTPRILVVLQMPQSEEEWMTCTIDNLILRRSAYWVSLKGSPDVENTTVVTIKIPQGNKFDVNGLRA